MIDETKRWLAEVRERESKPYNGPWSFETMLEIHRSSRTNIPRLLAIAEAAVGHRERTVTLLMMDDARFGLPDNVKKETLIEVKNCLDKVIQGKRPSDK